MTDIRRDKVLGIDMPDQIVELGAGRQAGVVGWGSTLARSIRRCAARAQGADVSHIHIRHIWPMPKNLGDLLKSYEQILVPEMNTGQLKTVLRDQYLVDAVPLNKVSGQPFTIAEIEAAIEERHSGWPRRHPACPARRL
jgi:2-oxoglutarate ferredoxin oxidoreductase subunit alpha